MKLETVETLLTRLEIPTKPREVSGIWHNVRCPFAPWYHKKGVDNHPSFGISVSDENRSYYKCLSCGAKGSLALLPAKLGKLRGVDYSELVQWAERAEYEDNGPPTVPEWETDYLPDQKKPKKEITKSKIVNTKFGGALGHPYLRKRGYSARDSVLLDLRFDEVQQRILFPVYNQLLQLEGYTGRSVMPDKFITKGSGVNPKSRDYGGLQKERLLLFSKRWAESGRKGRIILSEGPFDYARNVQAGFLGAHAIMGASLTQYKVDYFIELNRPVTLFLDDDVAGDAAMFGNINAETGLRESLHNSWAEQLYKHVPVWIAKYPVKARLENRTDPDSLTVAEIRESIKNAWLYTGRFSLPEYSKTDADIPF